MKNIEVDNLNNDEEESPIDGKLDKSSIELISLKQIGTESSLERENPRFEKTLKLFILIIICFVAFSTRLFSVVRFESIIHEFDPWFNYRATRKIVEDGFYSFWNWFDDRSWYPLGRVVGGSVYPGLMITAALFHKALHAINFPVDIRNVCVFMGPFFAMFASLATYLLTSQLHSKSAGLFAAGLMAIVPGYISRSVAGSYDNECIAIFLLIFCFYLWIKASKMGSMFYGSLTALFYFYMVSAWGGYAFITNIIPLHVFALLLMGRYSSKLYIAYCTWYSIGMMLSFSIPFVNFAPLRTSEHMGAIGVFGLLQIVAFLKWIHDIAGPDHRKKIMGLLGSLIAGASSVVIFILAKTGYFAPWAGRFYTLWDTNYARVHIPIISSVSEHQPTAWGSLFFDMHALLFLAPAGALLSFRRLRNEHVFLIIYCLFASYFSGVMVRLILVQAPIYCVSSGIALGSLFELRSPHSNINNKKSNVVNTVETNISPIEQKEVKSSNNSKNNSKSRDDATTNKRNNNRKEKSLRNDNIGDIVTQSTALLNKSKALSSGILVSDLKTKYFHLFANYRIYIAVMVGLLLLHFVQHCVWVTSLAYSSPSVILASQNRDGSRAIIDDFREAYYWLRSNTDEDATVMSWWDYGYQLAGLADRTTIVDNNTWNNTHIATVGLALASTESEAYEIFLKHDIDYVLVIYGGLIGFSGDDINKFLWMIRIAEGVYPNKVSERSFFTQQGEYRVDDKATDTMKNSLMYKMSYYRVNDLFGGNGEDRVRGGRIASGNIDLNYIEEAFTSQNWMVRIYKVKKPDFLSRPYTTAVPFDTGKVKALKRPTAVF